LGRGPGNALRDVSEIGSAGDDQGLQFHVAPDIGFARAHDGNVARLFQRFLETFEFDQFLCPRGLGGRCSGCGLAQREWMFGLFWCRRLIEMPAAPTVGPVAGSILGCRAMTAEHHGEGQQQREGGAVMTIHV